jgi:hypothetical protein
MGRLFSDVDDEEDDEEEGKATANGGKEKLSIG